MNIASVETCRKWAPFRVGYLRSLRPYPPDYGAAFAFSGFLYPLHRLPSLRSGYRRSGAHRAYPVDNQGGASQSGWDLSPGGDCGCRCRQSPTDSPPHAPFGHGVTASFADPKLRGVRSFTLVQPSGPSLRRRPHRGSQDLAIVPGATDVGSPLRLPE